MKCIETSQYDFFAMLLLFFLQKSLFVLSAYSLILMGALQFKDHSCSQGENSFLALYLILPHCVNFPHPKSHANNLIHASEPMRNYYRLTMTPTKGLRTLLKWSMWSNSAVENVYLSKHWSIKTEQRFSHQEKSTS